MADLQKTPAGQHIAYPGTVESTGDAVTDSTTEGTSLYLFLHGGVGADGKKYPKVDMSVWDQATMCGTCHVGGMTYEADRNGNRLPMKTLQDMGSGNVNPFTTTVWEQYTANGTDTSFATIAPWVYPQYKGNKYANGALTAPQGWGQDMTMKDPNTGFEMQVVAGQLMMPNVKEMDCLFCHLSGYDNVMSSVMVQAGSLNAAPAAGAGMFDMTPISPTYMGYNGNNGTVAFQRTGAATFEQMGAGMSVAFKDYTSAEFVSLTPQMVSRIKGKPESNNCHQCHATKTLKDFPEMFGVTGTSTGFLSSAPMIYDPANAVGPLGKRMTAYDINAVWGASPVISGGNYTSYMMPGLNYLQAMGATPFAGGTDTPMFLGGGNPAMTGPLYYYNTTFGDARDTDPDKNQNVLKRSTAVFARAEWFKRGDAWQAGQDVHSFGCGGCHFTGDSTHKNQCDPGRGFDMSSTTADGVPPISQGQVVKEYDAQGAPVIATTGTEIAAAVLKHDTRNTVKRCDFCHMTGKDYYGNPIDTYGAPNPSAAHQRAGLTANIVQIVDKMDFHGTYGGQGIPENTDLESENTKLGRGNHLDVMDCTVCHVQKVSMAVRALDATSGMRYPAVVGTDPSQGMMGLFEDPAPDAFNEGARQQYNQMFEAINAYYGFTPGTTNYKAPIPAGTHVVGGKLQEWQPLHVWQKLGNMEGPLSAAAVIGSGSGKDSGLKFRRKIYLSNAISAVLWNNTDPAVDANGDTVNGGLLIGDDDHEGRDAKPSLVGYTEIFDGTAPNKNNIQGYGEPIYDPWIMKDLKAGFNFGPSALSVISVGFGGFGTPAEKSDPNGGAYQSAYMADGTFSGAWKYVSVWSGAVTFTEPEEIEAYKAYRNAIEPTINGVKKDWSKTELSYVGAPFMVTHGVKNVESYVKGKSCKDCHDTGKGFFTGDFDMTGSALPASRTFNPTSQAVINYADGTVTRNAGIPTLDSDTPDNLFSRPLEPVRVKAKIGDLRTVFEGFNKLGQPRSTLFQESDATYTWTTPMERADVLYPEEDGAIYYRIDQVEADGTPKLGAVKMNGRQYASYMETLNVDQWAAEAGAAPVAKIDTVAGQTAGGGATIVNMVKNVPATVAAQAAAPGMTYKWEAPVGATITDPTAQSPQMTFDKPGIWRIALSVANADGTISKTVQRISVTEPVLINVTEAVDGIVSKAALSATIPVTIAAGTTYTKARVIWGDGTASTIITDVDGAFDLTHAYRPYDKYKTVVDGKNVYTYTTSIQLFDGTTVKSTRSVKVKVTLP